MDIEYIPMTSDIKNKYQHYTETCLMKFKPSGYSEALPKMTSLEKGVSGYIEFLKRKEHYEIEEQYLVIWFKITHSENQKQ